MLIEHSRASLHLQVHPKSPRFFMANIKRHKGKVKTTLWKNSVSLPLRFPNQCPIHHHCCHYQTRGIHLTIMNPAQCVPSNSLSLKPGEFCQRVWWFRFFLERCCSLVCLVPLQLLTGSQTWYLMNLPEETKTRICVIKPRTRYTSRECFSVLNCSLLTCTSVAWREM